MTLKVNSRQQARKLYVGIIDLEIVSLNPNQEELAELLGKKAWEPSYIGENTKYTVKNEDGEDVPASQIRLDFWMQNKEHGVLQTHTVWLTNALLPASSTGSFKYMGKNGNVSWAAGKPEDTFKQENYASWMFGPFRRVYAGEEELYRVLQPYINLKLNDPENELQLSTPVEEMVQGDLAELRSWLFDESMPHFGNKVKMLMGVQSRERDGATYWNNAFYPKWIVSKDNKSVQKLLKGLERDKQAGYPWQAIYNSEDLTLQEFDQAKNLPGASGGQPVSAEQMNRLLD